MNEIGQLALAIETTVLLGVAVAAATRSNRWPIAIGFNALLPATAVIAAHGSGAPWRIAMVLAFVIAYLIRMTWVLIVWYADTAGPALGGRTRGATLYVLPIVLTNVFGWLYCLPFFWAVDRSGPFDGWDAVSIGVYALGTALHLGSDWQKRRFRSRPEHRGRLLDRGLWSWSRHPNYFGDFLVYVSFALVSASPWGLVAPVANLIQYALDAIPKSEAMGRALHGAEWDAYRARVPCFVPRPAAMIAACAKALSWRA